jgi:hypothetical protein
MGKVILIAKGVYAVKSGRYREGYLGVGWKDRNSGYRVPSADFSDSPLHTLRKMMIGLNLKLDHLVYHPVHSEQVNGKEVLVYYSDPTEYMDGISKNRRDTVLALHEVLGDPVLNNAMRKIYKLREENRDKIFI